MLTKTKETFPALCPLARIRNCGILKLAGTSTTKGLQWWTFLYREQFFCIAPQTMDNSLKGKWCIIIISYKKLYKSQKQTIFNQWCIYFELLFTDPQSKEKGECEIIILIWVPLLALCQLVWWCRVGGSAECVVLSTTACAAWLGQHWLA